MKMKMKRCRVLLILGLLIITMFSGCAGSKDEFLQNEGGYPSETNATTTTWNSEKGGLGENDDKFVDVDENIALNNRKVILNASVSMEVDDFDGAYTKIKAMIAPYGYVQETSISKDKHYPDNSVDYIYVSRGVIVIRVDAEKFEETMENLSGIGTVTDEKRGSDDITYQYTDTEARIRLLEDEKERLEKYLEDETKDADYIFKIQSRLTEILYQIENYKGTIQKWDDLVSLSTITVDMREKVPGQKPRKEYTYWDRLGDSFENALEFCGDVVIFLISAIPILLVLGALSVAVWVFIRMLMRKSYKNKDISKTLEKDNSDKKE